MFEERDRRTFNSANERAKDLLNAVAPKIEDRHVQALYDLIRDAQREEWLNKQEFVLTVNEVLDAMHLRIKLPGGELARLTVAPGRSGAGFISFDLIGRGTRGGFATTTIELVSHVDRRKR
jgi:hypothetical protein